MRQRSSYAVAAGGRLAARAILGIALVCGVISGVGAASGSAPVAGAASLGKCSATAFSGPTTLRLKLASSSEGDVPTVSVCIDGKGPYPFLLATGVGSSVVSPSLARSLHLHERAATPVRGVTCLSSAPTAAVASWSMSGRKLDAQSLLVAKMAAGGVSPAPQGIIGSDVLARFGAVRIDYHTSRLVVARSEGAAPTGNVYVLGQKTSSPPASLGAGGPKVSALLRVFESPQGTIVAMPVKIAGHTEQLAVDSGSPSSAVLPAVARSLKLTANGTGAALSGVGCAGTASTYGSGAWSIGRSRLPSGSLESRSIAGSVNSGLQGVIGSNALAVDGAVIVDYEGAHLWLTGG